MTDKRKNKQQKMIQILELTDKYLKITIKCMLKNREKREQNGLIFENFERNWNLYLKMCIKNYKT